MASAGILGLSAGFFPDYRSELFLGWIVPAVAGLLTVYFILKAAKKDIGSVTKVIAKGFVVKMVYYGIILFILFKLYSFEPIPFVCSFAGFFLGLHALEAVIIKNVSQ